MAQKSVPVALHAPTWAQSGKQEGPPARLDVQRSGVTVGASITIREDAIEKHRYGNRAQHKEAHEHDGKEYGVRHRCSSLLRQRSRKNCSFTIRV